MPLIWEWERKRTPCPRGHRGRASRFLWFRLFWASDSGSLPSSSRGIVRWRAVAESEPSRAVMDVAVCRRDHTVRNRQR
ncbi:hypothetical protein EUGRSUZ_H00980 [Eucalyptus grandis]|uniref:Uncharacterized protein n=2 Tax=Eucalyptus grandis TaxID=71139 RepID=A0ACC3KC36_EUCGR|nr:hypothetical protein EUGRSUZ_H00980 [Eucalyptus grandis]